MSRNQERLTRYECARIIGIRASQIQMSAPILIDMTIIPSEKQSNFMYIAALEMRAQKLDMIVRRPLPMGEFYEVKLTNMQLCEDLDALIAMFDN